jgi:hypothetical protein
MKTYNILTFNIGKSLGRAATKATPRRRQGGAKGPRISACNPNAFTKKERQTLYLEAGRRLAERQTNYLKTGKD